jgi:hypothetical protein
MISFLKGVLKGKTEYRRNRTVPLLSIRKPYNAARSDIEKERFKFVFMKVALIIKYI